VIVLFALTLAFLALRITATTFSAEASSRALAAANAAAEDGVIKVLRNPGYSNTYQFDVIANAETEVDVDYDVVTERTTITASSVVGTNSRTVEVIVGISSSTGRVEVISWETLR